MYDTQGIKPPNSNCEQFIPIPPPPPQVKPNCNPIPAPPYIRGKLAIDKTLSKENYAADALTVGNLFTKIYEILAELDVEELVKWMNDNKDLVAYLQQVIDYENGEFLITEINGNGIWE